jgi:beta-galactosidase
MSEWHNDGQLSTAWIEYELEYPSVVNEITLKLNNFRSRTYPLRITVDDTEVFNDTTQRSLGYFTAVCKPVKGKKVKIQLTGGNNSKSVEKMIEVSGRKLDDGVTRDDANTKGMLSIIEAEIYQTINRKP